MFEIFNPVDGIPVYTTRYAIIARMIAYFFGLDYALTGEGWIK